MWRKKVYFSEAELTCNCGCGGRVSKRFERDLIKARKKYGRPMRVTNSYRCHSENQRVGGSPRSQHKDPGLAVDVSMTDPALVHELMRILLNHGFTVGLYETFLHIDKGGRPKPIVFRGDY